MVTVMAGAVLAGCGSDDEVSNEGEPMHGELEGEVAEEEEAFPNTTNDPLEFADKTTDDIILVDGANEYELKNYYVNDDTGEDGFNVYEEDDFAFRYALVETENIADVESHGNRQVKILGEIVNDTDETYYFDHMLIKTDDKESSEVNFGLNGAGAADEKNKFLDGFDLEYDVPDNFMFVLFDPTYQGDFQDDFEEENSPEYVEDDFPYEKKFKEYMRQHLVIEEEFTKE